MKRAQARSYVRLQFSALRAFYKFLADRKNLRIDPVRQLQLPKVEKKLPLVLTRQQIEELLSAPLQVAKQRAAPTSAPPLQLSALREQPSAVAPEAPQARSRHS